MAHCRRQAQACSMGSVAAGQTRYDYECQKSLAHRPSPGADMTLGCCLTVRVSRSRGLLLGFRQGILNRVEQEVLLAPIVPWRIDLRGLALNDPTY